jgi:hypothetical protein
MTYQVNDYVFGGTHPQKSAAETRTNTVHGGADHTKSHKCFKDITDKPRYMCHKTGYHVLLSGGLGILHHFVVQLNNSPFFAKKDKRVAPVRYHHRAKLSPGAKLSSELSLFLDS